MNKYDIVIVGGGVSGWLMYQRLKQEFEGNLSIIVIDKNGILPVHPFHLHRLIPEIKSLSNIKPELLKVEIWDGKEYKTKPSCLDVNIYSRKIFKHLNVSNINNAENQIIYPISIDKLRFIIVEDKVLKNGEITRIDIEMKLIEMKIGETKETIGYKYCINTLSLPIFMKLCSLETNIKFVNYPFWCSIYKMENDTNLYQMIYNSKFENEITRTTLLNDRLFIEYFHDYSDNFTFEYLETLYEIKIRNSFRKQLQPGRIVPLSNEQRKPLFHWLTQRYNIMCLGRYGAWAFKVTNDVWDDTKFICQLIYNKEQSCKYEKGL